MLFRSTYAISARWERWSDYNSPIMRLIFYSFSYSQALPPLQWHDIISGQLGYEYKLSEVRSIRTGYQYMPNPAPEPNGNVNILSSDRHCLSLGYRWTSSDRHCLSLGYRWTFEKVALLDDVNVHLDAAALVHYFTPKTVVKTDPTALGYPGYTIGGAFLGYGVTGSADF